MLVLPGFRFRQLVYLAGPRSALSAFHHATFCSHLARKEDIYLPCGLFQPSFGPWVILFRRLCNHLFGKLCHLNSLDKRVIKRFYLIGLLLTVPLANQKSFC